MVSSILTEVAVGFLYLYAGHQTWWRMLLSDPGAKDCEVTSAFLNGTLPFIVYAGFLALWLPLLVLSWLGWVATRTD